MKKLLLIMLCLAMFSLAACSNKNNTGISVDPSDTSYITMLEEGVWPENEYTNEVPIPPGTIGQVLLDTKHENCSVQVLNMDETEFEEYLQILKDQGYETIDEVSEEIKDENYVSIGTILSNGTTSLSIAYADGAFGIYIVRCAD